MLYTNIKMEEIMTRQKLLTPLLILIFLFIACKKDNQPASEEAFDLNNVQLEDYCIYANFRTANGGMKNEVRLFEFVPGNKIKAYTAESDRGYQYSYVIKNNNNLDIEGELYIITFNQDGKIDALKHSNNNFLYERPVLIKKPQTNQLEGKTFAGRYYTPQDVDIHNKDLIYKFLPNGKVEAGFDVNNPVRTEDYNLIGNIAATTRITGMVNSYEIMVLFDGKLEVNTRNGTITPARTEYGTFTIR